jgi:hypothetical protein
MSATMLERPAGSGVGVSCRPPHLRREIVGEHITD